MYSLSACCKRKQQLAWIWLSLREPSNIRKHSPHVHLPNPSLKYAADTQKIYSSVLTYIFSHTLEPFPSSVHTQKHSHTRTHTHAQQEGQTSVLNKDRQWNRFSHPAGPLATQSDHQQTSILISITNTFWHLPSKRNTHCAKNKQITYIHFSTRIQACIGSTLVFNA